MKILFLVALSLPLSVALSAQVIANPQPQDAGQPAAPAAAVPRVDIGCSRDIRPEIVLFCNALTDLESKAAAGMAEGDPRLSQTLVRLNPASRANASEFIPAINLLMATTTVAASTLQLADQIRTDQQFGSNSTASGTTTLVSKAGSAELLSLAIDTGAVTQSVNGSTATLATNADHLYRLITGQNSDCIMNCGKNLTGLSNFEYRFSSARTIPLRHPHPARQAAPRPAVLAL
jgi:hypothetical protein